jgi:hypothetical protein
VKSLQAPSVSRGEVSTMRAAGEYTGFVPDMQRLGCWPGVVLGAIEALGAHAPGRNSHSKSQNDFFESQNKPLNKPLNESQDSITNAKDDTYQPKKWQ